MYLGAIDAVYDLPVEERRLTLAWLRLQEDPEERRLLQAPLSVDDLSRYASRIGMTKPKKTGLANDG